MSEATEVDRPSIDGSALVQLGIIGVISFIVLALLLAGLARLTESETTGAVDVARKTITLALSQEPRSSTPHARPIRRAAVCSAT